VNEAAKNNEKRQPLRAQGTGAARGVPAIPKAPPGPGLPERRTRQRRKEARPDEILDSALAEFSEFGFGAARLESVARRAGIAKGTIYLYFGSKEELFEAVVRRAVSPIVATMGPLMETFAGSTEEFLRGPFRQALSALLRSDARHLARIMLTEGHAFPGVVAFYYREIVQPGMALLRAIVARGVVSGEFRRTGLEEYPQPLMGAPVLLLLWHSMFGKHAPPLDVDRVLETHIDLILRGLIARPE
jgi:AcrR family transcriptional regulator